MAVKTTIRSPMPVKMRAKQFMMFDAMKGLTEAIAEKERQYYPQKELTEERICEINRQLAGLRIGNITTVYYYCVNRKQYIEITGPLLKIDPLEKEIHVGKDIVKFCEIDRIEYN